MTLRTLLFSFLIMLTGYTQAQHSLQKDRDILLQGIEKLPLPPAGKGIAMFLITGFDPEIIATAPVEMDVTLKANVLSTSRIGTGKLILFGSPEYLRNTREHPGVETLIRNTLKWSVPNGRKRMATLTFQPSPDLKKVLKEEQFRYATAPAFRDRKRTTVLVLDRDAKDSTELNNIEDFVQKGGTLIFLSPYADLHENSKRTGKPVPADLMMNKLFAKAGLFSPQMLSIPSNINAGLDTGKAPYYLHLAGILERFGQSDRDMTDHFARYLFTDTLLKKTLAPENRNSPAFARIKRDFNLPDSLPVPTPEKPWENRNKLQKTALQLAYRIYEEEQDFAGHPERRAKGHEVFPGAVPASAPRISTKLSLRIQVGRQGLREPAEGSKILHSTGLYVPAGERVTIVLSDSLPANGLEIQVGLHDNELYHLDEIRRIPVNTVRIQHFKAKKAEVYSPYGGLLLIGIPDTSRLTVLGLEVSGAIRAPRFKLGETTLADWNNNQKNLEAPWAELATDKIILNVPSYRIRQLTDPEALMKFWDEVMDADADLAIIPRKRLKAERIIADPEVAFGYMFTSPEKIVVPDDESCALMLDEQALRKKGSWGAFHEIGHRHQFTAIDFPALTEVTVNLYTMYVYDKVLGKGLYNHGSIQNKKAAIEQIKRYLNNKPDFAIWCNEPFIALSMYVQIIEAFGWKAIFDMHRSYRNLPASSLPRSEQEKIDLWFVTISTATASDLGRFFETWKIPVSEQARRRVSHLKPWFPTELEVQKWY
ncbi:M60 family metallopeptidase [Pedobacter sp. SYP-B3415]|uniref:M60 family metallopeptidase n=1 Tax=Pedobacter sp. SYP-B3415 TaxID=2496641 RepID=UPI00101E16BE|nr:M60 family metallopeptidase [Pedobacter sp. SYP-B3415]